MQVPLAFTSGHHSTFIAMGILHFLFAICRGIVYSVGICRF